MSFSHKPATSEGLRLRLGIAGASRSGKTYSALKIATGMMKNSGKPIFFIDTENGFSLDYAREFNFQHVDFQPPFTSERYIEALLYCEQQGAGVIVVDSATHEHTGTGGVLERQEQLCEDLSKKWNCKRDKVTMAAWAQAKKPHTDLVTAVQRCKLPIIFCFRAKDKIKIVNVGGKQEISHVGWTAICTEQFEYEMTALLVLPPNSEGRADKELSEIRAPLRQILRVGEQISEQMGVELAEWASGGAKASGTMIMTNGEGGSHVGQATVGAGSGFVELISADQQIYIADLLAARQDLKSELLGALKIKSISEIQASKYEKVVSNIKRALEGA